MPASADAAADEEAPSANNIVGRLRLLRCRCPAATFIAVNAVRAHAPLNERIFKNLSRAFGR